MDFGGLVDGHEVEEIEAEDMQDRVGHRQREDTLAFQYVMDMRLGDAGQSGQPAFRQIAAADPLPKVVNEPPLQFLEVHPVDLFLGAIEE